jgi:perosamine synthetase
MSKKQIKLFHPLIDKNEEKEVIKILKSGFWASGSGTNNVAKFEKMFNQFIGSKDCIAVNSGTAALHLALSLSDIKGKEVILPSFSFASTAHAVIYNGGKPVFTDIEKETLCIDPDEIKKNISEKTRVILPVHYAGFPSKINEIFQMCDNHKLELIEDAAHAVGSKYSQKKIGSHGTAVCFSFHPVKNLAMPNGGAITLNNKQSKNQKKILNSLRWCGISDRKKETYDISNLGWNYYMNEISAGIGIQQLKKINRINKIRKKIARKYSQKLVFENKIPYNEDCSYHIFWILVKNRKRFMGKMKSKGIETGIHYLPIHKMTYYNSKKTLKNTEDVSSKIVSLPIHPNLSEEEIEWIIKWGNEYS